MLPCSMVRCAEGEGEGTAFIDQRAAPLVKNAMESPPSPPALCEERVSRGGGGIVGLVNLSPALWVTADKKEGERTRVLHFEECKKLDKLEKQRAGS